MRERPILFSAPMVRAILEWRKSQTRRTRGLGRFNLDPGAWTVRNVVGGAIFTHDNGGAIAVKCPYGVPGDRLWVRETFYAWRCKVYTSEGSFEHPERCIYAADGHRLVNGTKWRPSIFLPRKFSRILLEVADVRVQRVQGISKADALAEGISVLPLQEKSNPRAWYQSAPGVNQARSAQLSYAMLWDHINAKRGFGYDVNPWVWAISFKVLEDPHVQP